MGCLERMSKLTDLSIDNNPISGPVEEENSALRSEVIRKCQQLKVLDEKQVSMEEKEAALTTGALIKSKINPSLRSSLLLF